MGKRDVEPRQAEPSETGGCFCRGENRARGEYGAGVDASSAESCRSRANYRNPKRDNQSYARCFGADCRKEIDVFKKHKWINKGRKQEEKKSGPF